MFRLIKIHFQSQLLARATQQRASSDTFDDDVVNFCHVICLLGNETESNFQCMTARETHTKLKIFSKLSIIQVIFN